MSATPVTRGERAAAASAAVSDRVGRGVENALEKAHDLAPASMKGRLRGAVSGAREARIAQSTPPGKVHAGQHVSPEVVLREGEYLPMMPKSVREGFKKHRRGEAEMMGPMGYEPGVMPSREAHKEIMSRFQRGEL